MSLIEQLGGYNEARSIANVKDKNFMGCKIEPCPELDAELLEHRRANNIFESGDRIVSTLKDDGEFWKTIICEIEGFHKNMAITSSGGHTIHHYEFRHATDKEIAQGFRDA